MTTQHWTWRVYEMDEAGTLRGSDHGRVEWGLVKFDELKAKAAPGTVAEIRDSVVQRVWCDMGEDGVRHWKFVYGNHVSGSGETLGDKLEELEAAGLEPVHVKTIWMIVRPAGAEWPDKARTNLLWEPEWDEIDRGERKPPPREWLTGWDPAPLGNPA